MALQCTVAILNRDYIQQPYLHLIHDSICAQDVVLLVWVLFCIFYGPGGFSTTRQTNHHQDLRRKYWGNILQTRYHQHLLSTDRVKVVVAKSSQSLLLQLLIHIVCRLLCRMIRCILNIAKSLIDQELLQKPKIQFFGPASKSPANIISLFISTRDVHEYASTRTWQRWCDAMMPGITLIMKIVKNKMRMTNPPYT